MKPGFLATLAFAACLAASFPASSQSYPSKPLRWIVPFPPGGSTDGFSRPLAAKLSDLLGQPVVIENVGGAGASIGSDRIAKAAPDGYTIGLATTGSHAINPHIYGSKLPHDTVRDFTHITLAVSYVNVLVVHPGVPARSVAELIDYARANPGKVTFGSAGNGSSNHLSAELLKALSKAPMEHVPYKGSGPAMTDVMAGNITGMFDVLITSIPQMRAGRVRALAVTSATRSPYVPEVPTMAESGVAGYSEAGSELWFGIVGPAGIPRPIVRKLNEKLIEALRAADMRQRIRIQAFDLWTSTPEEFTAVLKADRAKWGKIVGAAGARID
ncbi:MAG: tripartite tricarboxylate transporter substrate binding protein [Candidatus Parcubacteria bacterium]|nr:tripartite tricarboxylate transporter substrate binding protein [Burkholderiales bacterium]